MASAPACAIVIFGASGDLAKRKLIPAIYEMAREKLLNEKSYIVGFSRSEMSDEVFRKEFAEAVGQFARTKPVDEGVLKKLVDRVSYATADYGSADDHARLRAQLDKLDAQYGSPGNRLFYLSTPPNTFEPIIRRLGESKVKEAGRGSGSLSKNHLATIWPAPGR